MDEKLLANFVMAGGSDKGADVGGPSIPKAIVTESNGEISCSVEETNRIRKLLGMKPLNIAKPETKEEREAERNAAQEAAEQEARKRAIADLERRVAKAKRKRMLNAKLEGQGLGDELHDSVGALSAAEWIKRNRKKTVEEERLLAERTAQKLAEQEALQHSAADLKGIAVRHDADAFEAGEDTILTLADQSVLDDDRGDVLQNENIADTERAKELQRIKKKSSMPVYEGTDDHEFEGVIGEKTILRQYDDDRDSLNRTHEHEKKLKTAFVLGDGGAATADVATKKPEVKFANGQRPQESLMQTVQATKIAEYYTKDELVSFKKKRRKKKKKKKKSSSTGEADTGGDDTSRPSMPKRKRRKPSSILDELEEMAQGEQSATVDSGSRSRSLKLAKDEARARAERVQREAARQKALANANADRSMFLASGAAPPPPPAGGAAVYGTSDANDDAAAATFLVDDDDDADLQRALARARAMKQKVAKQAEAGESNLESIAAANREAAEAERKRLSETSAPTTTMSFTSTSEFSRRLQAQIQEQIADRRAQEVAELKAQTESVLREQKDLAARAKAARSDAGDDSDSDDDAVAAGPQVESSAAAAESSKAKELTFMRNEVVHSGGIAATLALLKRTGKPRGAAKDKVTFAGRTNDAKREHDPNSRIKLVYKDKFGRELTPKEAFRQQSYHFHGIKPGRKRQEKELKKLKAEQALKKNKRAGAGMIDRFKQHQQKTGQAFVVLPGYK